MRFVTPLSLALALALTGGAVSAPASAAKKEEKPAGRKPAVDRGNVFYTIPAADLDRAQAFYETVLGVNLRREDFGHIDIRTDHSLVELE